jgi:hypothetical protein
MSRSLSLTNQKPDNRDNVKFSSRKIKIKVVKKKKAQSDEPLAQTWFVKI